MQLQWVKERSGPPIAGIPFVKVEDMIFSATILTDPFNNNLILVNKTKLQENKNESQLYTIYRFDPSGQYIDIVMRKEKENSYPKTFFIDGFYSSTRSAVFRYEYVDSHLLPVSDW